MQTAPRVQGKVGHFPERIAGAFAYFTFIPAIVFLFLDPYNKNRFVRFHSIQCLCVWVGGILLAVILKLLGLILFIIPALGPLLALLISVVAALGAIAIWLVLVIKALQGEMFKLPLLGDFSEQHAGQPESPRR
jgi:uncharacterized membrane protein